MSMSVATMAATETNSHTTCPMASSGARRVTNVMPMPERMKTMGSIAGSAPGASRRMAMCAATKATMRPMGTESVSSESCAPVFMTYME